MDFPQTCLWVVNEQRGPIFRVSLVDEQAGTVVAHTPEYLDDIIDVTAVVHRAYQLHVTEMPRAIINVAARAGVTAVTRLAPVLKRKGAHARVFDTSITWLSVPEAFQLCNAGLDLLVGSLQTNLLRH
jgi:hypothetical protein